MGIDDSIIRKLSDLAGVQTGYIDQQGNYRLVESPTLTAVLEALLDRPLKTSEDFLTAIAEFSKNPVIPDVLVAWNGSLEIPLDKNHSSYEELVTHIRAGKLQIVLENADLFSGEMDIRESDTQSVINFPQPFPLGYHTVLDEDLGIDSLIVSAPMTCPPPPQKGYGFALFAPTYAIVDKRRLSEGDLSSLQRFGELAAAHGAGLIATLPMFAEASSKDGASQGQSPYSPLSRSFFHEGYLDTAKFTGDGKAPGAPATAPDTKTRASADLAGKSDLIHPLLLKSVQKLLNTSDKHLSEQRDAFTDFCREKQDLDLYARFRAAMRLYGPEIDKWPHEMQNGLPDDKLLDQDLILLHKYAQFVMHRQLMEVKNSLNDNGCGLLFDLPIGCSKDSFDVWAYKNHFSPNAMLGAPPDDFFQGGQNWGLPPMFPDYDRKHKYVFFRNMLRTSLLYADVLRIDHILGFSRLWWIPNGHPATEGAYVTYRSDELLAVACLQAHKSGTHLLGEDLGTVETEFRQKMNLHGISHMRVSIFEFKDRFGSEGNNNSNTCPSLCNEFLYLDTHDTATFAGWLAAEDIFVRSRLCGTEPFLETHLLSERQMLVEKIKSSLLQENRFPHLDRYLELSENSPEDRSLFPAVLADGALSKAAYLVISLEDLIGETKPQNIPGTGRSDGNFCRLISKQVEDILGDKNTEVLLAIVREGRSLVTSQDKYYNHKGIA